MRLSTFGFFAACLLVRGSGAQDISATPLGTWRTFDDDTHAPKALVEISVQDGELSGRIVKLFREAGEDPDPHCSACRGQRKDQRVLGMTILWGMHGDGAVWSGGEILDPEEGAIYRAKLHLASDGKLEVRGYLGISLLGRTQVWERVQE